MKRPYIRHYPALVIPNMDKSIASHMEGRQVRIQVVEGGRQSTFSKDYFERRKWRMECYETALSLCKGEIDEVSIIDDSDMLWNYAKQAHGIGNVINPGIVKRLISTLYKKEIRVFWISAKQSRTPGHFDLYDNFNIQLKGSKRFILYPPRLRTALKFGEGVKNFRYTPIDIERECLFPGDRVEIITHPGDVLFIPEGWVHAVETLEDSMNVAQWYQTPSSLRFASKDDRFRAKLWPRSSR